MEPGNHHAAQHQLWRIIRIHRIIWASQHCMFLVVLRSSPLSSWPWKKGDTGYVYSMPLSSLVDIQKRWLTNNNPPMDLSYVNIWCHMGIHVKLMPMGASQHHCGVRVSSEPNKEEVLDWEEGMSTMGGTQALLWLGTIACWGPLLSMAGAWGAAWCSMGAVASCGLLNHGT